MGRHRIRYERRYGDEKRDLQRWESVAASYVYEESYSKKRNL